MTRQDPWFIEERALRHAFLVLTKNDAVKVTPHDGQDMGIDLLAEILKRGKPTLRFFSSQSQISGHEKAQIATTCPSTYQPSPGTSFLSC